MKRCCRCKQTLPDDCFTKDRARPTGLSNNCRTCQHEYYRRRVCSPALRPYDYTELLCRPVEHIIEQVRVDDIAEATGLCHSDAGLIKRFGTSDDCVIEQLRAWVRRRATVAA